MSKTAKQDKLLGHLRALVTDRLPTPQTRVESDAEFLRLERRMQGGAVARFRLPRLVLLPTAFAACAALVVFFLSTPASTQITYSVVGAAPASGGFVAAPVGQPAVLSFSDGSEVQLAASSRGRVASTNRHGARLALESGRARVHVVPRKENDWKFDAGPCLVTVTGTRFDMAWSPGEQVLEVWLEKGSVVVRGPAAPEGVEVRAGQHLTMNIRGDTVRLDPIGREGEAEAAPIAEPAALAPAIEEPTEEPAAAVAPSREPTWARKGSPWAKRVLDGDFAGVVSDAERLGLQQTLRSARVDDLMALADAARFGRRTDLARETLLNVRQRFAGSVGARKATFLLGRLAEESGGDLAGAIKWYDAYLASEGGGAYEAEAMGRKMSATARLVGKPAARAIAKQYLQRFPDGSYGDAARDLLKTP